MSREKDLEDWIFKFFGGVAVMIMVSSNLPQIIKIFKIKRSNGLSTYALLMRFVASIMILVYAFYFKLWEIFIPNVINLILTGILLIMKKCYHEDGILDQQFLLDEESIHPDYSDTSPNFDLDDGKFARL